MVRIRTLGEESPGQRRALLLPGANYSVQAPLLYWSTAILLAEGWEIRAVEREDADRGFADPQHLIDHVFELDANETSATVDLVIAKSLGSLALRRCVDEGIAGVWLTPLLNRSEVASALRAADERHLAIGGMNDRHWMPDAVQGTRAGLVSVDGADHALLHADWQQSMRTSTDVASWIASHVARSAR